MNISILIPSRNNRPYLELAYNSIRNTQGNHFVEILVLDDYSNKDFTWEWCCNTMKSDPNFKAFINLKEDRLGISSGYKFLSQQATQEILVHWHADMVMTEGTLDAVEKELYCFMEDVEINSGPPDFIPFIVKDRKSPFNKNVICLTRIEPPIYDKPGVYPEKIIWAEAPIGIEDWNEEYFKVYLPHLEKLWGGKKTGGHFAPFFMFREEYLRLGGNDILNFPLQAREDSDFGFRLVLDGFETIQIPQMVYHFASRGNRRSEHESGNFKDNPEWQKIDAISTRNFIRKWGTFDLHHDDLTPKKPVKYNIGFRVKNCNENLLYHLEPWCSYLATDLPEKVIEEYIKIQQPNTPIELSFKLNSNLIKLDRLVDIEIDIDGNKFEQYDFTNIQHLSEIITASGELGHFEVNNLKITIRAMNHYENELIICKNEPINLNEK